MILVVVSVWNLLINRSKRVMELINLYIYVDYKNDDILI